MLKFKLFSGTKKKRKKAKEKVQFGKKAIVCIILLWFLVALVGIVVNIVLVIGDPLYVDMNSLYLYVGAPMTGGIVAYLIESQISNRKKLELNPDYLKKDNYHNDSMAKEAVITAEVEEQSFTAEELASEEK